MEFGLKGAKATFKAGKSIKSVKIELNTATTIRNLN